MKTFLIVMYFSGYGHAVPYLTMEDCINASYGLDMSEVETFRCTLESETVEHD